MMRFLWTFQFLLIVNVVKGFINCPAEGYKLCNSSDVVYSITGSHSLNISDCIFENCPQIIISDSTSIFFNNITFRNGNYSANSLGQGGALFIQGSGTFVSITNSFFDRVALVNQGSAIYVTDGSVVIENCTFSGNKARDQGGAIMVYKATAFNCTRCQFISNAASFGGAVSVSGYHNQASTPASLINCYFDGNQAVSKDGIGNGGSLSAFDGAKLFLLQTNIVNGYAESSGGALYMVGKSTVWIENCYSTRVNAIFGAYLNSNGSAGTNTLTVKGSTYFGIKGLQGTFAVKGGATVARIESTNFFSCSAEQGSALYGESLDINAPINFVNCSFYDDYNYWGGAMFGRYSCTFHVDSCNFYNSNGGERGAAIIVWDQAAVTCITNSRFYQCRTQITGGAISIDAGDGVISGCHFEGCFSVFGGAVNCDSYSDQSIRIDNNIFINNKGTNGGDVFTQRGKLVTISNNLFLNSSASRGGSIYSTQPVTLLNNTFQSTKAIQFGGSLYAVGTSVTASNCVFLNSKAGRGGAAFLDTVELKINNVTFTDCTSERSGGVLFLSQGSASVVNSYSSGSDSNSGGFATCQQRQTLSMYGVQVSSSASADRGGVFYSEASSLVIESCDFVDSSSTSGGVFYLTLGTQLSSTNVIVQDSQAVFGATFYLDQMSSASCFGNSFSNSISNSNGSLVYAIGGSSISIIDSNHWNDVPETFTGCFLYLLGDVQLLIQNFGYSYGSGLTGTFVNAVDGAIAIFQQVNVSYVTATGKGASIVIADGSSSLQFTNCIFIYPRAEKLFLSTGASQISFTSTNLLFNVFPDINLPVWTLQINQVLFEADSGSSIDFSSSSQVLGFTGDTAAKVLGLFSCEESEITGSVVKYAPIYGNRDSSITIDSCRVSDNLVIGALDTCSSEAGPIGLGGAVASSGNVIISGSTAITSNKADYGGAIYISDPGALSIGSGAFISNNIASAYGGAFYIDTAGSCQVESDNVTVTNNIASSYPSSNFALFKRGFLQFNVLDNSQPSFDGGILVLNHSTAEALSTGNVVPTSIKLEGKAKVLALINYKNGSTLELTMNSDIPPIEIGALDGFNRLAIVDPANLVIINAEEVAQGSGLNGETIKTILDPTKRTETLYSLSITNRTAGIYTLKFSAKLGTLDNIDLPDMPLILNVHYRLCLPNVELFVPSENACIPIVSISSTVRLFISCICLSLIAGCTHTLFGLYFFKEERLIKANSHVFLSFPVLGCGLAFLSPVVSNSSCIISTALENIGFCLIFTSLLIKLYRIRVICGYFELTPSILQLMKERNLVVFLFLAVLVFASYEVIWGVFEDPKPVPTYIPSMHIVIADKCNLDSFFSYGMAAIKFVISVIVSYLAFVNRRVPSEFNEARYIGYSCYNWVIFGTFIGLTAQYLIANPDIGFAVKSASLILSHSVTTLYLATYKVHKCWVKYKKAKADASLSGYVSGDYTSSSDFQYF